MTRAIAVALALWCCACTIGRDYVGNALRSDPHVVLRPGVTTLREAMEIFGAPDKIQRRHRGDILIYRFVRQNKSELEIQEPVVTGITVFTYSKHQLKADRLTLFFDDTGVLTAFGYTGGVNQLDLL